jgi:Zn finger protein HypA/HybF involved in hydrogenase expression
MLRLLTFSLGITLLISSGIGFVLKDVIGFWQGFVGAVIAQFLGFYFLSLKKNESKEQETNLSEEIINLQTIPISCPCGKNTFTGPVFYNTENSFLCEKCGSQFKVELNYETVLLTEPLNIANVFNQLKEKELSDNKA